MAEMDPGKNKKQSSTNLDSSSHYVDVSQVIADLWYCTVRTSSHTLYTSVSHPLPALQNGRSQFVINGNWKISIPGEYNVAGTKLLYRRSADTWESFEVPGPTREDLHLMVRVPTCWLRTVQSP